MIRMRLVSFKGTLLAGRKMVRCSSNPPMIRWAAWVISSRPKTPTS